MLASWLLFLFHTKIFESAGVKYLLNSLLDLYHWQNAWALELGSNEYSFL